MYRNQVATSSGFGWRIEAELGGDINRYSQDQLDRCKKDIQYMGCLDGNRLRMIYNKLLKSPNCSKKILRDIHASLNNAGVTGLKKP